MVTSVASSFSTCFLNKTNHFVCCNKRFPFGHVEKHVTGLSLSRVCEEEQNQFQQCSTIHVILNDPYPPKKPKTKHGENDNHVGLQNYKYL